MSDLDKLKDAAGKALGDSNDYVQAQGDTWMSYIKKYGVYFVIAVVALVVLGLAVKKIKPVLPYVFGALAVIVVLSLIFLR